MNKKQKKVLVRILITAALLALLNLVQLPELPAMILYLAAYLMAMIFCARPARAF